MGKGCGDRLNIFNFQPCHGQDMAKRLGIEWRIAQATQPGFRKLHDGMLFGCWREGSVKLRQETQVAFKKQAQIVDAVTQHGQAIRPHAKGKSNILFRIETT